MCRLQEHSAVEEYTQDTFQQNKISFNRVLDFQITSVAPVFRTISSYGLLITVLFQGGMNMDIDNFTIPDYMTFGKAQVT